MKKTLSILISAFYLILMIQSCTTNLSLVNISSASFSLFDPVTKQAPQKLIPGKTYSLIASVFDKNKNEIKNIDYTIIGCSSPNESFINIQNSRSHLLLTTSSQSFDLFNKKTFTLNISISENPYPKTQLVYEIDWIHYSKLLFRGENGADGRDGYDADSMISFDGCFTSFSGSNDSKEKQPVNGGRGGNGAQGVHGKNGIDINIDIAYYNYEGTIGLIAHEKTQDILFFFPVDAMDTNHNKFIEINTSGGNGGKGGNGGDGDDGTDGGNGGDSGNGGDGGNGGSAGDITIQYLSGSAIIRKFEVIQLPGIGGYNGRCGSSGHGSISFQNYKTGRSGFTGNNGIAGRDGKKGSYYEIKVINPENLFLKVTHPEFKRESLIFADIQ